uniref:V-type proton ATPase subunit G n=1 Tax=Canis lupus familiaris TaxID=9615 RepID=A0A8P0NQI8_CANLF
ARRRRPQRLGQLTRGSRSSRLRPLRWAPERPPPPPPPWPASRRASSSCCRPRSAPPRRCRRPASAEIEQYRLQREKEFKAKEAAALGSHGSCSTEVEKETQEKMTILQTYFQQNRDEVLDNLLAFVCDIRPEIHENYRING